MEKTKFALCFIAQLCFWGSFEMAQASSLIDVYGVEAGCEAQPRKNASYILHLAAFKSKPNAVRYQHIITEKTHQAVRVDYQFKKKAPYLVTMGPFSSIDALRHTSCGLFHPEKIAVMHHVSEALKPLPKVTSYVGNMGIPAQFNPWSKIATLSLGSAWVNPHPTETMAANPLVTSTYAGASNSQAVFDGEIFLALQRAINRNFLGQAGVAVAVMSSAQLKGDIVNTMSHYNEDFLYAYDVSHTHLALKGKILIEPEDIINPYVSGSLGVAFNQANHYTSTPNHSTVSSTPLFEANTTTAFTYTVGAGIQTDINATWQVGLGYEFSDWGMSALAAAPGQRVGTGLQLNHLYSNAFLLNLTYSNFL